MKSPTVQNYGIHVDGRDTGITFATTTDAAAGALHLANSGFLHISIFDRTSGRVVEHVRPSPNVA